MTSWGGLELTGGEEIGVGIAEGRGTRPTALMISKEASAALKRISQENGVTLFMTLLAGLQTLICRYTGEGDIPIGTAIAGRDHEGLERLIGFFVNTLVLRGRVDPDMGFGTLLENARDLAISAYEHGDVPFERVVEAVRPERTGAQNPLFQFMFVLENTPHAADERHPYPFSFLTLERIRS